MNPKNIIVALFLFWTVTSFASERAIFYRLDAEREQMEQKFKANQYGESDVLEFEQALDLRIQTLKEWAAKKPAPKAEATPSPSTVTSNSGSSSSKVLDQSMTLFTFGISAFARPGQDHGKEERSFTAEEIEAFKLELSELEKIKAEPQKSKEDKSVLISGNLLLRRLDHFIGNKISILHYMLKYDPKAYGISNTAWKTAWELRSILAALKERKKVLELQAEGLDISLTPVLDELQKRRETLFNLYFEIAGSQDLSPQADQTRTNVIFSETEAFTEEELKFKKITGKEGFSNKETKILNSTEVEILSTVDHKTQNLISMLKVTPEPALPSPDEIVLKIKK